jgi:plastocyanin
MRYLFHAIALTTLTLAACGGSDGYGDGPTGSSGNPSGGGSTSSSIAVADNSFTPSATTVARGTTVTWTWGGRVQHNVTFDDGPASATQTAGTYTRTFAAAGTFPYHCTIHGTAMAGTVTVQ